MSNRRPTSAFRTTSAPLTADAGQKRRPARSLVRILSVSSLHLAGVLAATLLPACTAPAPATGPTRATVWIDDRNEYLETALSVLRKNHLEPRRIDRSAGEIESQPTTSKQWFEVWRKDAPSAYQTLESSLHTTRRTVKLTVDQPGLDRPGTPASQRSGLALDTPKANRAGMGSMQGATSRPAGTAQQPAGPKPYVLTVVVNKERYSAPERQVTTTSGALGIYSERLPTTEGLRRAQAPGATWLPQGRDALLERQLLDELTMGMRRSVWTEDAPPPDGGGADSDDDDEFFRGPRPTGKGPRSRK
ncbi:MAG: hypothetical protein SF069_17485 [Phycisphaerae bacterium]|nr:hypothetical protein [Phycisphaerae bacterium]